MYAMETGFFPVMGLLVGGALFALYWWVLRLKCPSRWAQVFIAVALLLTTAVQLVAPVREVVAQAAPVVSGDASGTAATLPSSGGAGDGISAYAADGELQTPPLTHPLEGRGADAHGSALTAKEAAALELSPSVAFQNALPLLGRLYLIGVVLALVYFGCQLLWLYSLCRKYHGECQDGVNIYHTDQLAPFSFGRNIFLRTSMDEATTRYVLMHELAHIRRRHFLKLCLLQGFTALNWYNPFAWLFFAEMRLQQEMEVDGDVLSQGIDREDYQLSLLRVCVSEGKWILLRTAYGLKPLKQRIIFMNTTMNPKTMRFRQAAAVGALALVMTMALAVGCQTREKSETATESVKHHPMLGCWTMDWISNTGSGEQVHPFAMHYGFYNDSTFLCFSYFSKNGMNMAFSISGEGYIWRGDTLYSADGRPTDYTFPDERTAISRWMKDSTQMAGVGGPDITEQWSRIEPDEDIVAAFRAAYTARPSAERPMDGTWLKLGDDKNEAGYLLVNDTVMMAINLHPSKVVDGFRYGGSGMISTFHSLANGRLELGIVGVEPLELEVSHLYDNHMWITNYEAGKLMSEVHYQRVETPEYLLRALAPALMETDE